MNVESLIEDGRAENKRQRRREKEEHLMADIQSKKEKERVHLKDQERKKRGRAGDKDNVWCFAVRTLL